MLSKREREYIMDMRAFEAKYGDGNAIAVRSRIRKKVERALDDLKLIAEKEATEGVRWTGRRSSSILSKDPIADWIKVERIIARWPFSPWQFRKHYRAYIEERKAEDAGAIYSARYPDWVTDELLALTEGWSKGAAKKEIDVLK